MKSRKWNRIKELPKKKKKRKKTKMKILTVKLEKNEL